MREKIIEQKLCKAVQDKGGIAIKFTSQGYNGMPDRILLFPHGKVAFVEVKAPGEKLRALQSARHKMLEDFGIKVFVVDSEESIAEVLDEI